ncbi:MAG TPA: PKD domain-containing protein, partial [Luteibaculaceae bacterium]|nr:PKD domain-containing protein [Luteibaculaceae bacterium]
MKENFESFVKKSVDQYDVDYNPEHWTRVSQSLDKREGGSAKWFWGGAAVLGALGLVWFLSSSDDTPRSPQPAAQIKTTESRMAAKAEDTSSPKKNVQTPVQQPSKMEVASIEISKPSSIAPLSRAESEIRLSPTPVLTTKKVGDRTFNGSFTISRSVGCTNEPFVFKAETNVPVSYKWNFGDGKESNLPTPAHRFDKPGRYNITLTMTSVLDGKVLKLNEGGAVTVYASPVAKFNFDTEENAGFKRLLFLSNQSRNTTGFEWLVNGKYYSEENPKLDVSSKGNYQVKLVVKNEFGCYDTAVQAIGINENYNLLAPTAFTPNDDGQNDEFLPEALKANDVMYRMEI